MSLVSQIAALATRIATEVNSLRSEMSSLGGGASVADTAPASPSTGSQWFNSATGQLFVYYDSYWVEVVSNTEVQALPIANVTGLQTELNAKADLATLPGQTSLSGTVVSFSSERSTLVNVGQHWAFGNGSADSQMAVPANCKLVMATLAVDGTSGSTDITAVVGKNGINQTGYEVSVATGSLSGVANYYSSPLSFAAGDTLYWEATSSSGTNVGSVITWYLLID